MEAKASKHASRRVRVCACGARARARGLMAALPGGGPAEDGSELRSHACGVAKVETRGRVPGVGRIVVVTPREVPCPPARPRAAATGSPQDCSLARSTPTCPG